MQISTYKDYQNLRVMNRGHKVGISYYTYKYTFTFSLAIICLIVFNVSLVNDLDEITSKEQEIKTKESRNNLQTSLTLHDKRHSDGISFGPKNGVKSSPQKTITIGALSSINVVSLRINDVKVYEKRKKSDRGIHVIFVNEYNGRILDTQQFDTCVRPYVHLYMAIYLKERARADTITIFLVKDDAQLSLGKEGKDAIKALGSTKIDQLKFRGYWIFISRNKKVIYEEVSNGLKELSTGNPVEIFATLPLKDMSEFCPYTNSKRREFCFQYLGFYSLCNCKHPSPIRFNPKTLPNNEMVDVPISIVASNRPHYLYKTLQKLLSIQGVSKHMVTVYIDGFHDQVVSLLDILEIRYVEHSRANCSQTHCQIHQSYKFILDTTAARYPRSEFMLILEEDLLVSDDFIDYFNQLLPVLRNDNSLLCISAWNDNGFEHSSNDPSMVYRVETMPGLGWVLKRDMYLKEFAAIWPKLDYDGDWDLWMRAKQRKKGLECLAPDISRTFHFGNMGSHVDHSNMFSDLLKTKLNTKTGNRLDTDILYKNQYENHVRILIRIATVLNHTKNPCDPSFIPRDGLYYVMYIKWRFKGDAETWLNIATCFRLWYLDVRGNHKHMWRFWFNKKHIIVVSSSSPYFVYKPNNVEPIFIPNEKIGKKGKFNMTIHQGFLI